MEPQGLALSGFVVYRRGEDGSEFVRVLLGGRVSWVSDVSEATVYVTHDEARTVALAARAVAIARSTAA